MTDDDLAVSCPDGCTEVIRKGGYHSCDLEDAAELGALAAEACGAKPRSPFARIPLVAGAVLAVALAGWWAFPRQADTSGTVRRHLIQGFGHYQSGDYGAAIRECDEALKVEPWNETAMSNKRLAELYAKP